MKSIAERAKRSIMYFSQPERKKREYNRFLEETQRLKAMSELELQSERISAQIEYKHHKNVLSLFWVSIVLAVFMNAWKYFFDFLNQILRLAFASQTDSAEAAKVGFLISVILIAALTATVLGTLLFCIRKSSLLYRNLLVIEEVENDNKKS